MNLAPAFEPDFASPSDWASMYRGIGWQVVPANMPRQAGDWKFPKLTEWKTFQDELVPDVQFERWYGVNGDYFHHRNAGLLTGRASGNTFVIDLDNYKDVGAVEWWHGVLEVHNNGMEIETCEQLTGGGGRQLFYRAPPDWNAPTNRMKIGVDIRGQGGFAMLPPSMHTSGKSYEWKPGYAPWECEIAMAPDWLLTEVTDLVKKYGSDKTRQEAGPIISTPSPDTDFNSFGSRIDGREDYMTRLVWGVVTDWYRACPIPPSEHESTVKARETYATYERLNKSRLVSTSGESNSTLLEREGRGVSLFMEKWRRAMGKWPTEVANAAAHPPTDNEWREPKLDTREVTKAVTRYVFEKISDLRKLPPAQWLVKDWVPEGGSGILYGKWAAGKSFIAFDLALHLAYGMSDWHDVPLPGVPCHVLVIAREGHQGFVNRIDAFKKHHGLIDDDDHITFMRGSVSFMRDEEFEALKAAIAADQTPYRMTVVDTVARVLSGSDLNETQIGTAFMERLAVIGAITSAATIGVHHGNKAGGMMGSTYFEANADFIFEVKRLGDDDGPLAEGEIFCTKQKDGEDHWKRSVAYTKIPLSLLPDGPSSLVVASVKTLKPAPKTSGNGWPDRNICIQIIGAIGEQWDMGEPWTDAQNSTRPAVKNIAARWRIPRSVAADMVQTWVANGAIKLGTRDAKNHVKGFQVTGGIV